MSLFVTKVTPSPFSPSPTSLPSHRLVSARHIGQNKEYENLQTEKAKSVFTDAAVGVRTGKEMFAESTSSHRGREYTATAASTRPGAEGVREAATALIQHSDTLKSEEETKRNEKGSQTDFHETPSTRAPPDGAAGSPSQLVQNGDVESVTVPSQSPETPPTQREHSPVPRSVIPKAFRRNKRKFLEGAPIN